MRISEDVLRYLTLRVDKLEEGPSPIMQSRGSRDDRPRRERYGEARESSERTAPSEAPAAAEKPAAKPAEKVEA
jgi:small subunit ribosomal protein S6